MWTFLVVAVVITVIAWVAYVRGQKVRAQALAGPAAEFGLLPVTELPAELPPFPLLNTGTNRRASMIMRGVARGVDLVVCDYTFYESPGFSYHALRYREDFMTATIACPKVTGQKLPPFTLEPDLAAAAKEAEAAVAERVGDGMVGSVAKAVMTVATGIAGLQSGWRFPDRPDVKYVVRGDETVTRPIFTPRLLDFLRDHPDWVVEGQGEWLLVTLSWQVRKATLTQNQWENESGALRPEQFGMLIRTALEMAEAFRRA